jgi:hypothetical protein
VNRPVWGSSNGIQAQRALLNGGTIQNGKVSIQLRMSHGVVIRELIARIRFQPRDDVTCYGGFVEKQPPEGEEDTHMRRIPLTNYVLNGIAFSGCFPSQSGGVFRVGPGVSLKPQCADPQWEKVIVSCGLGYMANTVTKCPLYRQTIPNVSVCEAALERNIVGVSYASVLVLRACSNGIDIGEPIISPYEGKQSKKKFRFICADPEHYATAGRTPPSP